MISLIHTDLAKGWRKLQTKKQTKSPKRLYTAGKQKGILFRCKKCFLISLLNRLFMYKRPQTCHPPENKKHQKQKSPGQNVPRKQVFQDRNPQSQIAVHLSETIHFLSNQSISVYLHRNPRQQKGCLLSH